MLTDDERIVLASLFKREVIDLCDEINQEADERLLEAGADRRSLFVDGVKVGDFLAKYSKPTVSIDPLHKAEAMEYLRGLGLTEEAPVKGWEGHFKARGSHDVVCLDTGETVGFLTVQEPKRSKGYPTVRKKDEAKELLRLKIQDSNVMALLEGE